MMKLNHITANQQKICIDLIYWCIKVIYGIAHCLQQPNVYKFIQDLVFEIIMTTQSAQLLTCTRSNSSKETLKYKWVGFLQ